MNTKKSTIEISREDNTNFNFLMSAEAKPNLKELGYGEDSCVARWSTEFDDGIVADLKVCTSEDGDPLWCEMVFFEKQDDGSLSEVCCTDVGDELTGDWSGYIDGVEHIVSVKLKPSKYIVVVSSGCSDGCPLYSGAYIRKVCDTLEEAKAALNDTAEELGVDLGDRWEPGYQSDPESMKWSDHYYDKDCLTAWVNGTKEDWHRVEIFTQNKQGNWRSMFN